MEKKYDGESRGHKLYWIIEIGNTGDTISRSYDILNTFYYVTRHCICKIYCINNLFEIRFHHR